MVRNIKEKGPHPPRQYAVSQVDGYLAKILWIGVRIASLCTVFFRSGSQGLLPVWKPQDQELGLRKEIYIKWWCHSRSKRLFWREKRLV